MLFGFFNRYKKEEVEYIIHRILSETVDRNSVRRTFDRLRPELGSRRIDDIIEELNFQEDKLDKKRLSHYMSELERLRQKDIF